MATRKQIAANRRNALKSTGPRTPEGKSVVSQNGVTHGLYATAAVIDSPHYREDAESYRRLIDSLIEELRPEGDLQHHLVRKIANAIWRYNRVIRAETGFIQKNLDNLPLAEQMSELARSWLCCQQSDDDDTTLSHSGAPSLCDGADPLSATPSLCDGFASEHRRQNWIDTHCIPNDRQCRTLLRYELRLDRQLYRSLTLLWRLKAIGSNSPDGSPQNMQSKPNSG